jgi:hypothetical protein
LIIEDDSVFRDLDYNSFQLPDGYSCIPLDELFGSSMVRLAIVLRHRPEPVGGYFLEPYKSINVMVYLGCIIDQAGRIIQWVDICVQSLTASDIQIASRTVNNRAIDRWWIKWCEAAAAQDHSIIISGMENKNPPPLILDIPSVESELMKDTHGHYLELCTDDKLLADNSLPVYSASVARFLYNRQTGEIAAKVVDETGKRCNQSQIAELTGTSLSGGRIFFNIGCGYILLRKHDSLGLDDLLECYKTKSFLLSEKTEDWQKIVAKEECRSYNPELFLNTRKDIAKETEILHLKTILFKEMLEAVAAATVRISRPILNLSPESWRVRILRSRHLPSMWSVSPILIDTGRVNDSEEFGANLRFFVPDYDCEMSIYNCDIMHCHNRGTVSIRLLDVGQEDKTNVYGVFADNEGFEDYPNGIINLSFGLSVSEFNFYGRICESSVSGNKQWEFYANKIEVDPQRRKELDAAKGVVIKNVKYRVWPDLGIACDLYSLAATGLRIYINNNKPIAHIINDFSALCRQVSSVDNKSNKAGFLRVLDQEKSWFKKLDIPGLRDPEDMMGKMIWAEILSMLASLMPEASAESVTYSSNVSVRNSIDIYKKHIDNVAEIVNYTRVFVISDCLENKIVRDAMSNIKFNQHGE